MATWTTTTVNDTYPKVLSIAQSKNTGQYMLSIVTNVADTTDARCRIFKSNDYGATWTLLEDLFPNNGVDTSHLNYATLDAASYGSWVFYSCAISDDGKYQSFGQKAGSSNGVWYSTNYGNTTGTTDEKWKYIKFDSIVRTNPTTANGNFPGGVLQMMYSPGPYPVYFSDYVYLRSFSHLTGLTPTTGSINEFGTTIGSYFTSTVPALYDNDFTTISRRVVYYISGGNLYKNTNGAAGVLINPSNWPVSNDEGGGIAVSADSMIVVAARFVSPNGGLWLSTDGGTNWTQKQVNVNLNTVDMSQDGKYIITGPRDPTSGTGRFYLSQDFGATWTFNDLAFTGILHKLHITNNGKRAVGAGMKSGYGYFQPTTTGYITYIAPLSAAEQRAAGKTVAQLLALSYSTIDIINAGYSLNELLVGGILPSWDYYAQSNRLKQSYVKDFIDISGSLVLRNNANLYVEGNTTVKGKLLLNNTNFQTDLSFNNRILVGSDTSMNGNATIANDVSLNGVVTGCIFTNNSIPTNAFVDPVTPPSPDYTKASVIYQQKFRADGDVSMNGVTVQATNITVNGNIEFNDTTKMSTYDDNKLAVSYTTKPSNYITSTGIPSTINIHDDTDNKQISFDGKYILTVGGTVNNNDHTNDTADSKRTGILLSSDYGVSYTFFYLKHPTLGTDLIKHDYKTSAISGDGKYMIVFISGTGTGTVTYTNTNIYGISRNYGQSWTTYFQSSLPAAFSGVTTFPRNVALNYDGSKAIIHAVADSGGHRTAVSQDFMNTWSMIDLTGQAFLIQIIGNYYTFRLGNSTTTNFRNFDGDVNKNKSYVGKCTYATAVSSANNIIAIICNGATITKLTVAGDTITETNISSINTANHANVSAVVSPSGKYILIGFYKNFMFLINDITLFTGENKSVYCSDNYGASFTTVTAGIINGTFPNSYYIDSIITDTGFIFIGSYFVGGRNILRYSFQSFKASTFSGLTIKNTLTAASYTTASDYRIKNNVAKLDNMITIDNLRPVKYLQTLLNKQQYGLIAHELQQYYPDLVIGEKDGQELQHVNYTGLIAILINEIIRLKQEFTELEKKRQIAT